jgi:hypothetical protein
MKDTSGEVYLFRSNKNTVLFLVNDIFGCSNHWPGFEQAAIF